MKEKITKLISEARLAEGLEKKSRDSNGIRARVSDLYATITLTHAMNRQPKSPSNAVWRCVQRLVQRLPILAFDAETESVAGCYCCQTAEEQAALRYGANWRQEYRGAREIERAKRWPVLSKLFQPNAKAQPLAGGERENHTNH